MGRIAFVIILCLSCSLNGMTQCMCGSMRLRIVLQDSISPRTNSDYSVSIVEDSSYPEMLNFPSNPIPSKGDTLNFAFRTGSGIDRLSFVMVNNKSSQQMKVTVLNMPYDTNFLLEFDEFKEGSFLFDWGNISACQYRNPYKKIISCDGIKFEQLRIKKPKNHFVYHEIRPFELELFRVKQ